jgi:histidyl-tRNA synthetase
MAVSQVNPPRGMRDFLPSEKAKREHLLAVAKGAYLSRGFQEIETPVLEELSRLQSGQGGDNEKLVFKVQKRGEEFTQALEAGQELADLGLRFDLTVPLTRYYATNRANLPRVFKAIQTGPVFRAERPQKGRYRQFVQCDIDIIGDGSILAELELLSASLAALAEMGVEGATIRVNHRELLKANIAALGVSEADSLSAMITIDKLDKVGIEGVAAELGQKFGPSVAESATKWLESIDTGRVPEVLSPLFSAPFAKQLRFDPTLVRGMGYYTGSIFEIEHPESSSSIGGGGRYDGMVGRWLGDDVPAVGISLGIERIVDLVHSSNSLRPGLVLLLDSPEDAGWGMKLQDELLAKYRVRLELRPKNLKAVLAELADSFDFFAVVGQAQNANELEIKPLS